MTALHERLGNAGHKEADFGDTVYHRPFRAHFLGRLLKGMAPPHPPFTVCESGFGAGHSALLFLSALPSARVHSFDHGLAPHSIPAHDWLDERYPDRLLLYLGDSVITVPQMRDYYPDVACNLVHVDGSRTAATTRADLTAFSAYAPAHTGGNGGSSSMVVLQNAGEGGEPLRVWKELVAAGFISWEGTVREGGASGGGDVLVYGHYTGEPVPPPVVVVAA